MRIGYHASHEQHGPDALLGWVRRAEEAGFQSAMCSDHFHPWSERQGHSGFAWSWLGSALEATRLSFGVVTVPGGWRYHPALIAQAAATLARMYPGRFWIAPGSGEALNERIVGRGWPTKQERNARLEEAVEIIRALWRGETVTRHDLIPTEEARLYSRPEREPAIVAAALTPETAGWAGGWADGLITTGQPREALERMVEAFRQGGGEGKPLHLQLQVSYARSTAEAERAAVEQWGPVSFPSRVLAELRVPADFEAAARNVTAADLRDSILITDEPGPIVERLRELREMGFAEVNVHNVGLEQEPFIELFGERVLPELAGAG